MPQVINISDEDIQYAESILLPAGKVFDAERRAYIRNMDTIDLQAVPGSGKTTVLLAKLLILETKLPFEDGSGVLVISHTNSAIDEIKSKIQQHCPKLFSYPNFIGTIQAFVDEFLAKPSFQLLFNKKVVRIDNEIYYEIVEKFIPRNLEGFTIQEQKNARYFLFGTDNLKSFRFQNRNGVTTLVSPLNSKELEIIKPRRGKDYVDFTTEEKKRIKEWLIKFKFTIMQKAGILHFDDAYFLAENYIRSKPMVKTLLQKRFAFVFADEMQDMDLHQYQLLETVFHNGNSSFSKYQRIGDKNQSIFNGDAKIETYWKDRPVVLLLTGSQRMSPAIANVVKQFALARPYGFDIVGLGSGSIKPHLIKYSTATINNVIPLFLNKIKELAAEPGNKSLSDRICGIDNNGKKKYPIKVVAWNTIWKSTEEKVDDSKVRLSDYFNSFSKEEHKLLSDYSCLYSYLSFFDKRKPTLNFVRKNILNAFLRILRLENINDVDGRNFTRKGLLDFINKMDENGNVGLYDDFKAKLYYWSMELAKGHTKHVHNSIVEFIPHFLNLFNKTIKTCQEFLTHTEGDKVNENIQLEEIVKENKVRLNGLEAEITTVHAAKGQTHAATLYLESCYYGYHESERLSDQFLGIPFADNRVRHKESTKMIYVGMSRPTDFLCLAIHDARYTEFLSKIDLTEWELLDA